MSHFAERFEKVVTELRAHPEIEVFGAELGNPTDAEVVLAACKTVNVEPNESMVEFYSHHNGAYLEWGLKGREYEHVGCGGLPDYGTPPGVINIHCVQDAFSSDWQTDYFINPIVGEETWQLAYNQPDPGEEKTNAVMIDQFSIYYHADMLLGPELLIVVSSDHGADLSCSDFLTFDQYLQLVIANYGANPYDVIGFGWSRPAARLSEIPARDLASIVEKIKTDEAEREG